MSTLPTDIAALQAIIAAQAEELAAARAGLVTKVLEIEKLKIQLARLRRMAFGRSSERIAREIEQLELQLEDLEETHHEATPSEDAQPQDDKADGQGDAACSAKSKSRRSFPDHLPRQDIRHDPAPACPECGGAMRTVGETVTEILDYIPGRFQVIRHIRPAVSCRQCETMVQPPMPTLPIERGMASPRLIAHVLVSKFCDHQPLYRQSQIFAREGVTLERSVLASMVGKAAALVRPLVDAIAAHVMAGRTLHADDTPVPVLSPGSGKTSTGRQWVYLRDERPHGGPAPPAVLYRFTPDRRGEHAQTQLASFRGGLHADGYAGFGKLYHGAVVEVACWAHVRRKIHDVWVATKAPLAKQAIDLIGKLFDVERQIVGGPAADRLATRQAASVPVLVELETFFADALARLPGKSDLAAAMRYATSRWAALTRYAEDGRWEISNNAAERAIRPVALGRKNWLFAGSNEGGERAAAIYSLIETAKLNGVNPQDYLTAVLSRIADHPVNRVGDLLPWVIDLGAPTAQAAE